jgi:hypothetical protein
MKRTFAWFPAVLLAAACGGSDDPQAIDAPTGAVDAPTVDAPNIDAPGIDAPVPIDAPVVPPGSSHTYVTSVLNVPENATEAMQLGLDIDNKPNDGIDNQLGMVLGSIGTLAPDLDPQGAADFATSRGVSILLLELIAENLAAGPAALSTHEGLNPNPPACNSPQDTVCGRHLTGVGTFDVGAAQTTQPIVGTITAPARFTGSGGIIVAPLVLGTAGTPAWLPLRAAKAELATVSATGFTGKIGGAVTQSDLNTIVIPAVAISIRGQFDADCNVGGTPPCACTPGSSGETMQGLFDNAPENCQITDAEVMAVLSGFLTMDIDLDMNGTNDAISIGVGVTAVPGTFTPP